MKGCDVMPKVDVVERIENLLGFVGKRVDAFSKNSLRVDIASGLAAALSLSAIFSLLHLLINSPTEYNVRRQVGFLLSHVLLCVACYLAPVAMLHLTQMRRFVPSCVVIVIFGSILLICSAVGYDAASRLLRSELPFGEALAERLWDGLGALVVLSVLTLPVTCVVHYAGAIVRTIDRWHNGEEKLPSIVG
ncbi:MAG: hypothetical protein H0V27_14480 [Pyrinomonadaceae bacterium]|nr:hypothetical protein [Pyrinomonadaceae bacterium]